ncbi:MAG: LysE family translocator, partial [Flavobacteriaceae bacterium]
YFSSFQLLENLSNQPGLYVFGGVILVVYGLTIVFKKGHSKENISIYKATKNNYLGLFVKGFLLNFINIGVLVFWLGVIIVVGPSLENDANRIWVFFATMLGAYLITDIIKILFAKQLKRKLTPNRIHRIKKGLGAILVACGIFLIVKGFLPKDRLNIEKGIERIEHIRE